MRYNKKIEDLGDFISIVSYTKEVLIRKDKIRKIEYRNRIVRIYFLDENDKISPDMSKEEFAEFKQMLANKGMSYEI